MVCLARHRGAHHRPYIGGVHIWGASAFAAKGVGDSIGLAGLQGFTGWGRRRRRHIGVKVKARMFHPAPEAAHGTIIPNTTDIDQGDAVVLSQRCYKALQICGEPHAGGIRRDAFEPFGTCKIAAPFREIHQTTRCEPRRVRRNPCEGRAPRGGKFACIRKARDSRPEPPELGQRYLRRRWHYWHRCY